MPSQDPTYILLEVRIPFSEINMAKLSFRRNGWRYESIGEVKYNTLNNFASDH
jgi:hypothetical protein